MALDRRHILQGMASASLLGTAASPSRADAASVVSVRWPSAEIIPLWPDLAPGHAGFRQPELPSDWPARFLRGIERPEVHVFRPSHPDGRSVLVCPGGAYLFVSIENEGVDVANAFNAHGITVFVLAYRLPCEGWAAQADVPLQDAQRAMRVLRDRAHILGIDPAQLGILGFSAGGHLAATLATRWMKPTYAPVDAADRLSARPAHAAFIYPVITLQDPLTHHESRRNLLGDRATAAEIAEQSPELHVASDMPRCFIAHASDDEAVPVDHALLMQTALRQAQVRQEVHLFETGNHAFGIGIEGTPCAEWPRLYNAWLRR